MTTSHDPQRCACGYFLLPPNRDACAAIRPGVNEQHGRLHCEQIELGEQVERKAKLHSRRWVGIETMTQLAQPREITLQRLDRH